MHKKMQALVFFNKKPQQCTQAQKTVNFKIKYDKVFLANAFANKKTRCNAVMQRISNRIDSELKLFHI